MSKHHNSDFNWNEHEAIQSSKQVHRIMHNQLQEEAERKATKKILKEAAWFIASFIILTSPLWIEATGLISN